MIIGALTAAVFFAVGLQTAGGLRTVASLHATQATSGDMDGDGAVTIDDAILALEIAEEYQTATAEQRKADPNGDGLITVSDALTILHLLSSAR